MKNKTPERRYSLLLKSFLMVGLFWTVFIAALLIWAIKNENNSTTARTLSQARSFFKQIVLTRYWNATLGGVYVPVTKKVQPNPYLDVSHRDLITKDGKALTLINPAFMTRQIADFAASRDHIQFHITSLKPIRPGNAPVGWEAKALRNFSTKSDEYYEWWLLSEKEEKTFRYMAALWTEKPCLACHSKQGYAEGDLRGGISVTIPANDILAEGNLHTRVLVIGYLLMWAMGILGIFFSFRLSRGEYIERSRLIEKLKKTLNDVKTLKGLIPICTSCKKVRDDEGYWGQIESYIKDHSDAEFSHSFCPDCVKKLYPEFSRDKNSHDDSTG